MENAVLGACCVLGLLFGWHIAGKLNEISQLQDKRIEQTRVEKKEFVTACMRDGKLEYECIAFWNMKKLDE
jgi:hypothetical protein